LHDLAVDVDKLVQQLMEQLAQRGMRVSDMLAARGAVRTLERFAAVQTV
jgi:phosphate uptake regulator